MDKFQYSQFGKDPFRKKQDPTLEATLKRMDPHFARGEDLGKLAQPFPEELPVEETPQVPKKGVREDYAIDTLRIDLLNPLRLDDIRDSYYSIGFEREKKSSPFDNLIEGYVAGITAFALNNTPELWFETHSLSLLLRIPDTRIEYNKGINLEAPEEGKYTNEPNAYEIGFRLAIARDFGVVLAKKDVPTDRATYDEFMRGLRENDQIHLSFLRDDFSPRYQLFQDEFATVVPNEEKMVRALTNQERMAYEAGRSVAEQGRFARMIKHIKTKGPIDMDLSRLKQSTDYTSPIINYLKPNK